MPSEEHETLCEAVLSMPLFAETLAETRANFAMLEYCSLVYSLTSLPARF